MNPNTITLDAALLRVIKRRNADRMKHYRRYVAEGMRLDEFMFRRGQVRPDGEPFTLGDIPLPDASKVAAVIARHRSEGFTPGQFADLEREFQKWEPSIKRERARLAASARWKKKTPAAKKSLRAFQSIKKSIKHRPALH